MPLYLSTTVRYALRLFLLTLQAILIESVANNIVRNKVWQFQVM